MSAWPRVAIAGAGQAGFQVAASLRSAGFAGDVTLIGDEPGEPYQRPPLSKAYLKHGNDARLRFRKRDFFDRQGIRFQSGRAVLAIDTAQHELRLDDERIEAYDHLVLALGARNRELPLVGRDLSNVFALRTLEDAESIRARLENARRVAIIGGGFIGLEFATVARARGLAVTVFEAAARLMARAVCPALSEYYLDAHREAGVDIRLNARVTRLVSDDRGRVAGAETVDGHVVPADVVLLAAGVVPNTELAAAAGLRTDDGIVVDADLSTEDPAISAIGDCASFVHPAGGRVRLESVQNATDQAKCVAARLLECPSPYAATPWFWSEQHGGKLQIAGLTAGAETVVTRPLGNGRGVVAHCFRGAQYLGTESVDAPAEHIAARKLLALPRVPQKRTIATMDYDLRALAIRHKARSST